ncbi:hypothetical protein F0L68_39860 [Solihabitans fulvus]|uniref:SD-repeat containing protein B domain-containing protein n=1 Tax=Solihabitans fulvus TaxID=1892852 RepID=A0A5B2W901_9PSEU|nr:SdrD B-like domain-containing protein [Solihabitans fulvus]KAA2248433.1 hypothetical protein F0L68_39860 [Solihabitans fulvus]
MDVFLDVGTNETGTGVEMEFWTLKTARRIAVTAGVAAATLVPLAVTGTAVADPGANSIAGAVWFDRNGDGAAQAGEPGVTTASVRIFDTTHNKEIGVFKTDAHGRFRVGDLVPGTYTISDMSASGYLETTPGTITCEVGPSQCAANFGLRGASVSGIAWKDLNGDGIRQPGEAVLPGVTIHDYLTSVVTGPDGSYRFDDLPTMDFSAQAPAIDPTTRYVITRPHQGPADTDSDFDWANGWLPDSTLKAGEVRDHVDVGYTAPKADQGVTLTSDKDLGSLRAGEDATVTAKIDLTNDWPGMSALRVELPEGLSFGKFFVPSASVDKINDRTDEVSWLRNQESGYSRYAVIPVHADRATTGEVVMRLVSTHGSTDTNPSNDVARAKVVVADPQSTPTTAPPVDSTTPVAVVPAAAPAAAAPAAAVQDAAVTPVAETKALANTGVAPLGVLGLGVVVLVGGGAAVWAARRKRA